MWAIPAKGVPFHVRVPIARNRLASLVARTTAALRTPAAGPATRGEEASTAGAPADDDLATLPMRGVGLMALSRDDRSAWRDLYETLIVPVRAQLPKGGRLTIIPHGPLFQLSFAALRSATGRYLVEDYELNYAPSISVLQFTSRRQAATTANASSAWAIVGNPATLPSVGSHPLAALPGAGQEIDSIAALAPKGRRVIRLAGGRAGEADLARALETAHPSVLHLATHGFVFDDLKQPPFLALNKHGTQLNEDGRLTLDEVYGLRLNTDLVVLSACRSGSGRISSDGVIGLTRGFFYAGSPSVLATFWDVTDAATAELMSGFYRQYAKTHAKGSSLRAAQLALLADLRAGRVVVTVGNRRVTLPEHPLLWAAFFLSGEP
jgi:CHAT domain-containing protein